MNYSKAFKVVCHGAIAVDFSAAMAAGRAADRRPLWIIAILGFCLLIPGAWANEVDWPDPVTNPTSALMLDLPAGTDIASLPRLSGEHAVVSAADDDWQFRLHNYLAWHDGQYWATWSHGPEVEDYPTQHLRYATSPDGLNWSQPKELVPPPTGESGYIARGLWQRDGELIALASRFRTHGFANPGLQLEAFSWNAAGEAWQPQGVISDNTINNFAPKKLPDGQWMMSRRTWQRDVSMLVGGVEAIDQWAEYPLTSYNTEGGFLPEEPYWYLLPDGENIVGLFRNNNGGHLLRSFSTDSGRTWSALTETNFPDATSKFFIHRTSRGYYVMVSNANPDGRYPLFLSVSSDGLVFTQMAVLEIALLDDPYQLPGHGAPPHNQTLQYPHVVEHDGDLVIMFSRNKHAIETFKISLDQVEQMLPEPASSVLLGMGAAPLLGFGRSRR